ncbi:dihydrofolate reductase [Candidatus Woesearchaeota archaeon]|nr:dihydrofolate reductase [Candidatus Woesearchaeota archaeon]
MKLTIIAAVAKNYVETKGYPIGKNGKIPWHIPEDLKRFKQLTKNHAIIMGRKTYESIPKNFRPLKNRLNIVLTRQKDYFEEGIVIVNSLDEAIHSTELLYSAAMEILIHRPAYIIGGENVYKKAMPLTDCLEITHVDQVVDDADAFFPKIDEIWKEIKREDHAGYSFATYVRR